MQREIHACVRLHVRIHERHLVAGREGKTKPSSGNGHSKFVIIVSGTITSEIRFASQRTLEVLMSQNRYRNLVTAGLALCFATIMGATPQATSAPSYDGLWSVVIVTETGTCDRAYRYPIRISNGTLVNAGDEAFVIAGKASANGSVNVTVSHGEKHATGSGRLSGNAGGGSWRGGDCAGTWEAERRNR